MSKDIFKLNEYNLCYFENYFGENEGLAILSKSPFTRTVTLLGRANALIGFLKYVGENYALLIFIFHGTTP